MTFYLRWRVRALAYLMLLDDAYPPFGDAPYPATLSFIEETGPRDRLTVGLRLILVIPHLIVVGFLGVCWWITTVISWFAIVLTGTYPPGLHAFGRSVLQ